MTPQQRAFPVVVCRIGLWLWENSAREIPGNRYRDHDLGAYFGWERLCGLIRKDPGPVTVAILYFHKKQSVEPIVAGRNEYFFGRFPLVA